MPLLEPEPRVIDSDDRFDVAISAIRKRSAVSNDDWSVMDAVQRERAFTVAHVTQARVLQGVLDSLQSAVERGTDFREFKDQVTIDLVEAWGGAQPGRIETIFRTNVATAYGEGRHAIYSSPSARKARPFLRFDAIEDDRLCDICSPLDGVIRPQEEWDKLTVPLHHNCRCVLVPLSAEEADDEGIADEMPDVEPSEGFGEAPSGEPIELDLDGLDPELREMVLTAIGGAPAGGEGVEGE